MFYNFSKTKDIYLSLDKPTYVNVIWTCWNSVKTNMVHIIWKIVLEITAKFK